MHPNIPDEDDGHQISQRGSHRQLKHPTKPGRVTVAGKPGEDIAQGTFSNILRQAGMER